MKTIRKWWLLATIMHWARAVVYTKVKGNYLNDLVITWLQNLACQYNNYMLYVRTSQKYWVHS